MTTQNFGPGDVVEFGDPVKVGMVLGFTEQGYAIVTVDGDDFQVSASDLRPVIQPL